MTITLSKTKLAIAVLAVALLAPATAFATHTFPDVPDGEFYTDAVEWAFDNKITTGTSATTFEPDAGVTRGQNVTFAKRYDDNIVQPALANMYTKAEVDAAVAAAATSIAFASALPAVELSPLVPVTLLTLDITVPTNGVVIVNGNANVIGGPGISIDCWINIDDPAKNSFHGVQHLSGYVDEWADNLGFDVTPGDHTLYLGCQQMNGVDGDLARIQVRRMTAVFSANSL